MGFVSWLTGRDVKEQDLYVDIEKAEATIDEVNNIANSIPETGSVVSGALSTLQSVNGMDLIGGLQLGNLDAAFDTVTEQVKAIASQMNKRVGDAKYYSSSGWDKFLGTLGMIHAKTTEGFLDIFEGIGDGVVSILGYTGIINKDWADEFVARDLSHELMDRVFYSKEIANYSIFTEDSRLAGAYEIVGNAYGLAVALPAYGGLATIPIVSPVVTKIVEKVVEKREEAKERAAEQLKTDGNTPTQTPTQPPTYPPTEKPTDPPTPSVTKRKEGGSGGPEPTKPKVTTPTVTTPTTPEITVPEVTTPTYPEPTQTVIAPEAPAPAAPETPAAPASASEHFGGGYSGEADVEMEPELSDLDEMKTSIEDILKNKKNSKIPTSIKPIAKVQTKSTGSTVIPMSAGLSSAAAVGLGAKAYLDSKTRFKEAKEEEEDWLKEAGVEPEKEVDSALLDEDSEEPIRERILESVTGESYSNL